MDGNISSTHKKFEHIPTYDIKFYANAIFRMSFFINSYENPNERANLTFKNWLEMISLEKKRRKH